MATGQYDVIGGLMSPVSEKYGKPGLLPAALRVEMCRLGAAHSDWIDIDDWESKQTSWTRTAIALENLKQRLDAMFPGTNIHITFLMSFDTLEQMTNPKAWDQSLVCAFFFSFINAVIVFKVSTSFPVYSSLL